MLLREFVEKRRYISEEELMELMALAQIMMIAMLFVWQRPLHASAVIVMLAVQIVLMRRLLQSPRERAPWYNGTGVSLYVLGMLVAAFALAGLGA